LDGILSVRAGIEQPVGGIDELLSVGGHGFTVPQVRQPENLSQTAGPVR
jgi:hypothetical protein